MKKPTNRRKFIQTSLAAAVGISVAKQAFAAQPLPVYVHRKLPPSIKFSVIGLNHGHIYGQTAALIRGGGELVSFYAKEADLAAAFAKRYPDAKLASSEEAILEDKSIQMVLSAGIPIDRAPLGIRVMQHGKDYMSDKPGIITLKQLAQVRKVQAQTGRIYSIMYSERFENRATVKAGELVQAGAIGQVIQTIGLGPHRISLSSRPSWFFDKKFSFAILAAICVTSFYISRDLLLQRYWPLR